MYSRSAHLVPCQPLSVSRSRRDITLSIVYDQAARFFCVHIHLQSLQNSSSTPAYAHTISPTGYNQLAPDVFIRNHWRVTWYRGECALISLLCLCGSIDRSSAAGMGSLPCEYDYCYCSGIRTLTIPTQSKDKDNKVFAIVRNPSTAVKLAPLAEASPNVHVVQGDLDDVASLKVISIPLSYLTYSRKLRSHTRMPLQKSERSQAGL